MSDMPDISSRDSLAEILEGRSDDEINAFVDELGVSNLIESV